jgi:hypothetical protein
MKDKFRAAGLGVDEFGLFGFLTFMIGLGLLFNQPNSHLMWAATAGCFALSGSLLWIHSWLAEEDEAADKAGDSQ